MNTEQTAEQREKFEAWALSAGMSIRLAGDRHAAQDPMEYFSLETDTAWAVWQAAFECKATTISVGLSEPEVLKLAEMHGVCSYRIGSGEAYVSKELLNLLRDAYDSMIKASPTHTMIAVDRERLAKIFKRLEQAELPDPHDECDVSEKWLLNQYRKAIKEIRAIDAASNPNKEGVV